MFELILFLALIAARSLIEVLVVPRRWQSRRPTPGRGLLSLLVQMVAYVASCAAVAWGLYRWGSPPLLYYPGLAVMAAGFTGRLVCVRQLGTAYSQSFETDPAGRFVTTGIYSLIRHPVYTTYFVEMSAFLLIWFNLVSAAALVLVVASSAYRIPKEEEQLIADFGDRYRDYRRRTRAVIPYIL